MFDNYIINCKPQSFYLFILYYGNSIEVCEDLKSIKVNGKEIYYTNQKLESVKDYIEADFYNIEEISLSQTPDYINNNFLKYAPRSGLSLKIGSLALKINGSIKDTLIEEHIEIMLDRINKCLQ